MEDDVFKAFDAFGFEKNENFRRGWACVKGLFETDAIEREYMKAKVFFFSKYIYSFDFEKYKAWKLKNGDVQPTTTSENMKCEEDKPLEHSDVLLQTGQSSADANGSKLNSASLSNIKLSKKSKEETHVQEGSKSLEKDSLDVADSSLSQDKEDEGDSKEDSFSLAELAAYIQNGLPIPGLIPVDVEPTNKDPTPSSMTRRPKPWELNDSGKNSQETTSAIGDSSS